MVERGCSRLLTEPLLIRFCRTRYFIYWAISQAQWAYIPVAVALLIAEGLLIRYLIQANVASCLDACVQKQADAIKEFEPDIVVASSWGGGVAVHLLARGLWKGATLLLAPAQYPSCLFLLFASSRIALHLSFTFFVFRFFFFLDQIRD